MMEANIKPRRLPERRCTGCGEHFAKNELIRVLRTPEGEILIDFTGKKSGRGAYICKSLSCLKKARKSQRIAKNLGLEISDEIYDVMEREISENE